MALHVQQRQLPTCSSRTSKRNRHGATVAPATAVTAVTAVAGLRPHARHAPTAISLSHASCATQHRTKARLQPCRVASLDRPAIKPAEEGQQPGAGADSASTTERMKQQSQTYLDQYVLPPAREVLQQVSYLICAVYAGYITMPHAP
jgi:hypothetical protein